jgi:hypothetical protein
MTIADDAPIRLEVPPPGYTAEEWGAMRRASESLDFGYVPPLPKKRDIGVPIPDAPVEYREDLSNIPGWKRKVRLPNLTYLIRCGDFVKIGITSDIEGRLRALESCNPHTLTVIALLRGGRALERALHKRFAEQRHRDEWFREEGELADWIDGGCEP